MDKKVYKFSYGNKFKKILSKFIMFIYNLYISVFILIAYAFIVSTINYELKYLLNDNSINVIKSVEIYAGTVWLFFFMIQAFLPQKVIIYDEKIKINRNCLFFNPLMIFRGFNDTIFINQIKEIYRPINKDKYLEPIPVNMIDWDNMVLIKKNNSLETIYYMPVEHSEKFIEEVSKRMEKIR